jgi:DNA repair protein RecO (recombination protein O)
MGKFSGIVRDLKSSIQAGDISVVEWRGRTADQLGSFKIENVFSPFCYVFGSAVGIFAIDSACTLCVNSMHYHVAHDSLFEFLRAFLLSVANKNWFSEYVFFEMSLLSEVGYGLNLSKCAVSGKTTGLQYISPKTGRAVTGEVGVKYQDRLFRLPDFMISREKKPTKYDVFCALNITGHFLRMYFYGINGKELPLSRNYLMKDIMAS